MIIDTKFDIGQYVYGIFSRRVSTTFPCHICDQKGSIQIKDVKFKCPNCMGATVIQNISSFEWVSQLGGTIVSVTAASSSDGIGIFYEIYDHESEGEYNLSQDDCFAKYDEALMEAAERNEKRGQRQG